MADLPPRYLAGCWLLLALLLPACSSTPYQVPGCEPLAQRDPVYFPLDQHGRFAVSRYLASVPAQADAWWAWSEAMAAEAASVYGASAEPCTSLDEDVHRASLIPQIHYPDEYSIALRTLGLYPLTRLPFVAGVAHELDKTAADFDAFKATKLPANPWRVYSAGQGSLAIPDANVLVDERFRRALAGNIWQRFAPQFAVEQGRDPSLNQPGLPMRVDGELLWENKSVVFGYASVGQFRGQQTLQLNYQIWFRERPASSRFDPLAGQLDGLHWRVHLNGDLQPVAFDAMHTCGCWYQIFPASGFQIEAVEDFWQEPVYVGVTPPALNPLLVITADTHSLVGLRVPVDQYQALHPVQLAPAKVGSRQPLGPEAIAHRRLFSANGTVPESARWERYFFWPMGIAAAGSMRAPGRHAVAFTGRRHFDDPELLDSLGLNAQKQAQVVE